MSESLSLDEALTAAAETYGWESEWTADGESAQPLKAWRADSLNGPRSDAADFTFDGVRIGWQGADVQDCETLLYLAEKRCDMCGRFVDREPTDRFAHEAEQIVKASLCVNCVSGGVIGRAFGRR